MTKRKVIYRDEYVMVTYHPAEDYYAFSFQLVEFRGKTEFFLGQSLLEEFANNDINHLSSKLGLIDLAFYQAVTRADVRRIHRAIRETHDKYLQEPAEFREKEGL